MTLRSETFSTVETETASEYTKVSESTHKTSDDHVSPSTTDSPAKKTEYKVDIIWINVIGFSVLHLWALYGLKLAVFNASWWTLLWTVFVGYLSGIGVTAGAHRLWCHRSYIAAIPLQLFLCFCNCVTFQDCIYDWCRNHRVHHKYSETDADPYSAKRGFFFCHLGWMLCKKHPDVLEKGKTVDISDLRSDPIVMFQRKWYLWFCGVLSMYAPAAVPYYLWGEDPITAFFVCFGLRYILVLHAHCYINSGAHLWGNRPYDKNINPAENFWASVFAIGEGYHNFHHTFPWDYAASEWGWKINLTTWHIDMWARMGLAYNLKKVSQETINRRRELKGDGSEPWFPEVLHQQQKAK